MSAPLSAPAGFRGRFISTGAELDPYGEASGILRAVPGAVAVPADARDVAALARWAAATGTPLVPRGAGTGMPGGNVGDGVVVDMVSRFRHIGTPRPDKRVVGVQPGATLAELNAACAPAALHFPVDPSSAVRCSLGGMLANNSAGAHSVRYGATRRWVRAVELILADGSHAWAERGAAPEHRVLAGIEQQIRAVVMPRRAEIEARWPRVRKNSSGYALREYLDSGDLVDLLVGSEGTLALIVGAVVELANVPADRGVALLEFTSLEATCEAILALLPEDPATCEMLDRTFIELVRDGGADSTYPLRPGLEAILLVEAEGESRDEVVEQLGRFCSAVRGCVSRSSTAVEPDLQHAFWEIRHAASPLIAARARGRVSMQFIEDSVVPVPRLPEYVRALRVILAAHGLPAVIFGHAGDGNLHVNPLVDVVDPAWRGTLETVLTEVATVVAELGGTLSGEHGDGRLRAPFLEAIWGPELVALFREVKSIFDPTGILNPGVVLPLPGQRSFDALRSYPPP